MIITSRNVLDLRSTVCRRKAIAAIGLGIFSVASSASLAAEAHHHAARHHARGSRRHIADGKDVQKDAPAGETHVGLASFYGAGDSTRTASGERFNPRALTAAHRTLPLGTTVRVTNLSNGKAVVVRINDRGPYVRSRVIDLSRSAAEQLDFISRGVARVRIETV